MYQYSHYEKGDQIEWSRLQATTGSFASESEALEYFQNQFGLFTTDLEQRCLFLKTNQQQFIGSAIAWYGDGSFDERYGRLHWVVIHPDFRGQGLGRQLIIFTLQQLRQRYSKAYLTTQTTSFQAIKIYLDLGFRPSISTSADETAWKFLKDFLKHPALL
jgi:ribosomal protein S18 acetylase RimI-like enzyme